MRRVYLFSPVVFVEDEEWRDVPGFEGLYQASNTGLIKSLERIVENSHTGYKPGKKTIKERILRPSITGSISLCKDGKSYSFHLANVILRSFIGPPSNEAERNARHLDDNTKNNNLSNLAWGSHQDNYNDGVRNNRHGAGTPGALIRGNKLRGKKRPDVDTRRKEIDLINTK